MSKWFAQGNASSDSEDDEGEKVKVDKEMNRIRNVARELGSDSEEEKRVVRTEKDKKWLAMRTICNKIKDKMRIDDFTELLNQFLALLKEMEKSKKLLDQEPTYPSFLMNALLNLLRMTNEYTNKAKLNVLNAKALNTLKQKLRKFEKDFAKEIEKFNAKPQEEKEESSSEEEFDSDEQNEDEEEEEDDTSPLDSDDPMVRRKYWLKKKVEVEEVDSEKEREKEEKQKEKEKEKQKEKEKLREQREEENRKTKIKQNQLYGEKRKQVFTSEQAQLKLRQIAATFGKQISREEKEEYLEALKSIKGTLTTDAQRLSLMLVEIPFRIEANRKHTHIDRREWTAIYSELKNMYAIVTESEEDDVLDHAETYQVDGDRRYYPSRYVIESMRSFFITLEDELNKGFILTDFNDIEYSELLQQLVDLIEFSYALFQMLSNRDGFSEASAEIGFKLIENTYYMNTETFNKIREQSEQQNRPTPRFLELEKRDRFEYVVSTVLEHCRDDTTKTKIILYSVYNHCIHGRENGKELLLVTDVIERAAVGDYFTQVIFNRAIVQVGLLAFRSGNMYEAQAALNELCSQSRTKELLGQSTGRQETVQKNKLLPYHLHINVDLIESSELIASMVLEIPYTLEDGGRITSKTLKKVYEHYEKSHFIAEPLNSRDLIYSASKELQKANWKECYERLMELNMWRQMHNSEACRANLLLRIKEQALKCFLIANKEAFTTMSLTNLSQRFELPAGDVRTVVCRMIYHNDLLGAVTDGGFVRLYHHQINRTEKILAPLFDEALKLIEQNERDFDKRLGNYVPPADEDELATNKLPRGKKRNMIHEKYRSNYIKKNPNKK